MLDISISSGSFSFFCWHFSMNIYALKQACSRTLPDTLQTFCELLSTVSSHPWDYYHYSVLYHSIAKLNEAVFFYFFHNLSSFSLCLCLCSSFVLYQSISHCKYYSFILLSFHRTFCSWKSLFEYSNCWKLMNMLQSQHEINCVLFTLKIHIAQSVMFVLIIFIYKTNTLLCLLYDFNFNLVCNADAQRDCVCLIRSTTAT